MKKLFTLTFMVLAMTLIYATSIYAQRTISGIVTDDSGEGLIGANVLEKGTTNGTITDLDGSYSLTVADGATLVFSFTGYTNQEIAVGNSDVVNIQLDAGELLDEVVVIGYGTQSEKEITSSVVKIENKDFNQGPISDPSQLLQGKVAGLQVYNRGGDPNGSSVIRLRGISTVGANAQPLVVVDGIIGASLDNVDPNDIENINVLKDGSAAAIYGSRGSSGVIIVTTKSGANKDGRVQLNYSGQIASGTPVNGIKVMTAPEFVAAGGTDLGSATDWIDEVTRTSLTNNHSISASGGSGVTSYRVSANIRNVEGILLNSGFNQFNTRINFSTRALNDKLRINFNSSFTNKDQELGFQEALRYAVIYNPTAPIFGDASPYPFNSEQFGGYFETLGLFDSFNPVSLIKQNSNRGNRKEFNYTANLNYSITDNFSANFRIAQQNNKFDNKKYYATTSLFRGGATSPIRKGQAELYNGNSSFDLYELYGTYTDSYGSTDLTLTGGYSYQQENFDDQFFSIGDFPNNDLDFLNAIENAQDLLNAGLIGANSNASPDSKIIAFFGRANVTINNGLFVNASVRYEGSSKLGEGNKWGIFPAFGIGADLTRYLNLDNVDQLKVRLGYGVTGALPAQNGLSQEGRALVYDGANGGASTTLTRAANPDLRWEQKRETNFGIEFAQDRFSATLDLYNRDIQDFILLRTVDIAEFGVDKRVENAGSLNTKGYEVALNYDVLNTDKVRYNTGLVFSGYSTTLNEYVIDAEMRANLGSPGQNATSMIRIKEGDEIGVIWGPVFNGVLEDGSPDLADVNGDGQLVVGQDKALDENVDFARLGSGIPDIELGWSNQISIGDWSINAFFRGAFGHSLINTFRAFYEPQLSTQSSYNYMNTALREEGLTTARFSSLYVEKADFIKLDNFTIGRSFDLKNSNSFESLQLSITAQNPFVITNYTGTDPEPSLVDGRDVLSPGIDRRTNYFATRSFTLGVNLKF